MIQLAERKTPKDRSTELPAWEVELGKAYKHVGQEQWSYPKEVPSPLAPEGTTR